MKILKNLKALFARDPKVLLEGHDVKNRFVQMVDDNGKYYVIVDDIGVKCDDLKDAELEFEFRLHDANKNF